MLSKSMPPPARQKKSNKFDKDKKMFVKGRNVQVNMQRRHMEFIAQVVRSIESEQSRNEVAMLFADAMGRENVNSYFDSQRFVKACVTK